MTPPGLRVLGVGAHALLVEVAGPREAQRLQAHLRELAGRADALGLPEPRDLVPAARTVLIDGVSDPAPWAAVLGRTDLGSLPPLLLDAAEQVVQVRYDGPDLDEVAAAWDCSADAVVERHTSTVFTVAFCGFAPGFAYCTAEPPLPPVPRRPDPRERVAAGSVAFGGEFCGVYPRAMPGGWQVVGRTDAVVFEPAREPPALLAPGDRVRFEAAR